MFLATYLNKVYKIWSNFYGYLKILEKHFILALFHIFNIDFWLYIVSTKKRADEHSRREIEVAAAHVGPKAGPKTAPALVFELRSH
jgi:hypothetical protein